MDFDNIWGKARKRFKKHQNRQADTDNADGGDANVSVSNAGGAVAPDGKKSNDHDLGEKPERKQREQLPTDRWSNLFIGLPYEMGNEFTIERIK